MAFDDSDVAQLKPTGAASFLRSEWPSDRQDVRWLAYGELNHIDARISTDVIGALYLGGMTEVSPRGLTEALWAAAERCGAEMVNAEVLAIDAVDGAVSGVTTSDGAIAGGVVVLAAGPWSRTLLKQGASTSYFGSSHFAIEGRDIALRLG